MVRAGEYEQLTVRSLARRLGVSAMALYRHVEDKDDLLEEGVDRLLAELWRPRVVEDDWREWILEAAERMRAFLVSQPAALHVYLAHPVSSPTAMERMQAMLGVLRRAGLSARSAWQAYGAIHTYTIGFAALEASRKRGTDDERLRGVARQLARYTTPRQFAMGLSYLLEGIARLTTGPERPAAAAGAQGGER